VLEILLNVRLRLYDAPQPFTRNFRLDCQQQFCFPTSKPYDYMGNRRTGKWQNN